MSLIGPVYQEISGIDDKKTLRSEKPRDDFSSIKNPKSSGAFQYGICIAWKDLRIENVFAEKSVNVPSMIVLRCNILNNNVV